MSGLLNKFTHRNGDASLGQQPIGGSQFNTVESTTVISSVEAPLIQHQTIVAAPVVQETIRNDRVVEIQPVVHRSIDQQVVHHIEKHITEAPAPNMGGVIERNPLIAQTTHTSVVNEVQPIIHREIAVPIPERVEQHHVERIVEPTVHTHEVTYETVSAPGAYGTVGLNEGNIYGGRLEGAPGTRSTSGTKKHGLFHRH